MDVIDRDELEDELQNSCNDYSDAIHVVRDMPTVDAVPLSVIEEIKAEIMEQFEGCDICRWDEDYDYEENNISEYKYIDSICSILKIIDEKVKEQTDGNNNRSRDAEI